MTTELANTISSLLLPEAEWGWVWSKSVTLALGRCGQEDQRFKTWPWLHSKVEAHSSYMRSWLKQNKRIQWEYGSGNTSEILNTVWMCSFLMSLFECSLKDKKDLSVVGHTCNTTIHRLEPGGVRSSRLALAVLYSRPPWATWTLIQNSNRK